MVKTIIFLFSSISLVSLAQEKKQFSVENTGNYKRVDLCLKATTGNCFILPSHDFDFLNIYSNQDVGQYAHSFSKETKGTTCKVRLSLEEQDQKGVGQKISYQVFGGEEKPNKKYWKVYLTEATPYALHLDYGLSSANVDLSGLAIEKLKIITGSADVNVSYSSGIENKITMDTFYIKVDIGTVTAKQINLARSKVVLADVGFGNMYLDFSNKPTNGNHIVGSVGAGNLIIQLPDETVPVMVHINNSWLSSVNLSKSLKKMGDSKYANLAYSKNPKGALTFDLDVSMGKIIFKER